MNPRSIQVAGVTIGWLVFAATVIPIVLRGRARSTTRAPLSLLAMLLQGLGFSFAWGHMREVVAGLSRGGETRGWTIAVTASALALASGLFAVAAVRRLGVQWSIVARVTEGHELITSGPYAVVRHPIYTAMLGLLIATGLTFGTPLSTLAGAVLYVLGTWLRTRSEERLLASAFGPRYEAYRRQVPALIPWLRLR
jgi:protein-S-isoprenylcysteine O-methyltransferase Ste14